MSPRVQVYILGALLIFLGAGLVTYKSQLLGLPIIPGAYRTVWTVEAKVEFEASGGPVKASLALPKAQGNMEILDEIFSTSGYGFVVADGGEHQRAEWSRRDAVGSQALYYKVDVYQDLVQHLPPKIDVAPALVKPDWSGARYAALRTAASDLVAKSRQSSADTETFTSQLLKNLSDETNNNRNLIFSALAEKDLLDIALGLLAYADIPARILRGIYLEDDRSRLPAETLVEISDGERWLAFNLKTGARGLPSNFLVWQRGDKSLLDVEGGSRSRVRFSTLANDVPSRDVALRQIGSERAAIIDYSIYSLPIEQQSIFKYILMVPVGALVVIFLRVVVGIRTAGTFMPVLLAIAFIQTTLINGVLIFLLILGVGLWVRSYLSRLDLLLVARIAAVVVIVVGLMAMISISSYKLGLEQVLTITFFPLIIIAWTIEHMSILWEDDGPTEVFVQTAGSLLVAILCFMLMTNSYVEHWMFNFPELLLVILGVIVILGHYTGYRLSELLRFRHMKQRDVV